jgi:hypothetical protein
MTLKNDPLEKIAREVLGIETLRTQNSNRLDFPEVAVWRLRDALQAAFRAGVQSERQRAACDTLPTPGPAAPPAAAG